MPNRQLRDNNIKHWHCLEKVDKRERDESKSSQFDQRRLSSHDGPKLRNSNAPSNHSPHIKESHKPNVKKTREKDAEQDGLLLKQLSNEQWSLETFVFNFNSSFHSAVSACWLQIYSGKHNQTFVRIREKGTQRVATRPTTISLSLTSFSVQEDSKDRNFWLLVCLEKCSLLVQKVEKWWRSLLVGVSCVPLKSIWKYLWAIFQTN